MNAVMDSIKCLLWEDVFVPWANLDLIYQLLIATLVIGVPVVYFYETFRYKRLAREALVIPHIAPISVRGGISRELGSHGAGLVLRTHLAAIAETFRKGRQSHGTIYGEVIALVSASLNVQPSEQPSVHLSDYRLHEDSIVKIGTVEIPIGSIVNLFLALLRVFPVRHRSRYLASLIHVSLVSSNPETTLCTPETQLIVYRQGQHVYPSNASETERNNRAASKSMMFTETKTAWNFEDLSDQLRDAAFMVLQLVHGKALPGHNWLGMKYFGSGLDILDEFRRTGKEELLSEALESFRRASEADTENYEALYIQGALLLVQREKNSITSAINLLTRALKTDTPELRALVNAGLARCYIQQFHRLARRKLAVLKLAEEHAEKAQKDWDKAASGRSHPWILATRALVKSIHEGIGMTREEARSQFLEAAELCHEAIESDRDNGTHYNVLGWILLKLAEWRTPDLKSEEGIPVKLEGNPAENAKDYFSRALELDPTSKLTHANLCLLYATPWYRERVKEEREKYLDLCRYHGGKAIGMDANYIHGYRDIAFSLLRYRKYDEAYSSFKKALQLAHLDQEKQLEMIQDASKVFNKMRVNKKERNRWLNPDLRLMNSTDGSPGQND